jgi:cystathionine gamma-synthase
MGADRDLARLSPDTLAIVAGRPPPAPDGPVNPPIVLSSTYHAGGPVGYGRDGNPTWTAFEEALGALEGGLALGFASGMAATAAVLELLPAAARVVVPSLGYYGVRALTAELARLGKLGVVAVDQTDTEAALAAADGAALVWLESPANPLLGIADLEALCAGARERGALAAVDNTFATPLLQRPLDLGADVVVHSATKYLGGHSDVLLGATVVRDPELNGRLANVRELFGAIPGPVEASLVLRGMRTLGVRLARAQASAAVLAGRLSDHAAVERVLYPGLPHHPGHALARAQMSGFGAMVSFEVRGGAESAERVAAACRVITHATSLGSVETLIERRRRWPGESPEVPESLLRLSVGCEDVDDLWADLARALSAV